LLQIDVERLDAAAKTAAIVLPRSQPHETQCHVSESAWRRRPSLS
jgi:hypothetical protein